MVRFWCGSLSAGLAYLGGERLLVETISKSFGTVVEGQDPTVVLNVVNHTGEPVRVIGAKVSCSCLRPSGLPATIPAGQAMNLELNVRTLKRLGAVQENIRWYTDSKERSEILLVVSGTVRKS